MMAMSTLRAPRDFAGDKAAALDDFFAAMAKALARGDPEKQQNTSRICNLIRAQLCARNIFDIGGLVKMSRKNLLAALAMVGKDLEFWVESLEDILEIEFHSPLAIGASSTSGEAPASGALVLPQSMTGRVSTYTAKGEIGLGAELLELGTLEAVVFVYAMFTKLTTANPKLEEIREAEVQHVLDTCWEFTVSKFGKVNIDIIYRKHVGTQLRLLFPKLPKRGKVEGKDRNFTEMLKWRFSNPRKRPVEGKVTYKAGFVLDRINICEEGLALIDEKKFPLALSDKGTVEKKFIIIDKGPEEHPAGSTPPMPHFGYTPHEPYESEFSAGAFQPRSKAIPRAEYFASLAGTFMPTVQAVPHFDLHVQPHTYAIELPGQQPRAPAIATASTAGSREPVDPQGEFVCSQKRTAEEVVGKENAPPNKIPRAKAPKEPKGRKAAPLKPTDTLSARTEPVCRPRPRHRPRRRPPACERRR